MTDGSFRLGEGGKVGERGFRVWNRTGKLRTAFGEGEK